MSNNLLEFSLHLNLINSDDEELQRATRQLFFELQDTDIESVKTITAGSAPQGTKAIDPILLGALAVAVTPTMVTKFLEFLHAWAMRKEGHTIKLKVQTKEGASLEIEVPTSMSPAEAKNWVNTLSENIMTKHKGKK